MEKDKSTKMREQKIKETKALRLKLKFILEEYILCKIRLQNPNNNLLNPPKKRDSQLNYSKQLVHTVELILSKIDPEFANIIKSVYIDKKQYSDIGYSISTYYVKLRLASKTFLRYIN
ncbi:MAG: hypothetical protein LBT77_01220 [Mycoplasmataceae bacterium]|nr:hypothetical protein [Mycoplasmataceae bacterium]